MKVKYIEPDIGVDGLLNGNIYQVCGVDDLTGYLSIIDESGEDYLYHPKKPQAVTGIYQGGHFEIIEDEQQGTLYKSNLSVGVQSASNA